MATYIHLYREMRLFYPSIAADSAAEAARVAAEKQTDEAQRIEDSEGVNIAALVDVQGDTDYEHSVVIDLKPRGQGVVTTQATGEKTARLPDSLPKRTLLEELAEINAAYAEGETTPEQESRGHEIVALANAAPKLLASLKDLLGDQPSVQGGICQHCGRDYIGDMVEGDCPADDCPSYEARAIIGAVTGGSFISRPIDTTRAGMVFPADHRAPPVPRRGFMTDFMTPSS